MPALQPGLLTNQKMSLDPNAECLFHEWKLKINRAERESSAMLSASPFDNLDNYCAFQFYSRVFSCCFSR